MKKNIEGSRSMKLKATPKKNISFGVKRKASTVKKPSKKAR